MAFSGLSIVVVSAAGIWYSVWPTLPDVESLRSVELQTPLRIYTRDRKLIREFGEKRRVPLKIAELPPAMKAAVIDTEEGLVFLDTSGPFHAARFHELVRAWSPRRVHTAVYTHGHVDHVFGLRPFEAEAKEKAAAEAKAAEEAAAAAIDRHAK